MLNCLSDPNFIAINRLATQPFRNAELATIPASCGTVGKATNALKVKQHHFLYEISADAPAEWVDSSREICAVFRGEVVFASIYSVAAAFGLPLMTSPGDAPKKLLAQCPNVPAVYADPQRWSHIRAPKRRERVQNDDDDDDEKEAGNNVVEPEENEDGGDDDDDEDNELERLDIRVFVSPRLGTSGDVLRARITPGRACLVIREEAPSSSPVNQQQETTSGAPKFPAKLQPTVDLLSQLGSQAFAEHFTADQFFNHYKEHVLANEPLDGAQTLFVDNSVWIKIEKHLYGTTLFATKDIDDDNDEQETVGGGDNDTQQSLMMDGSDDASTRQQRRPKQQPRRGAPRRRLVALCSFGVPSQSVLRAAMQRLRQMQAQDPLQIEETSIALFAEIPTLHYDPKTLPGETAEQKEQQAQQQQSGNKKKKKMSKRRQRRAAAMAAPLRRSRAKLAKLQSMITSLLSDTNLCPFREMDVVINAGSRYAASPARLPSTTLFKSYVRDLRGGVEVLDTASLVVLLQQQQQQQQKHQHGPGLLVESFAKKLKIPFQSLAEFLGEDLLEQQQEHEKVEQENATNVGDAADDDDDDGFAFFGDSSSSSSSDDEDASDGDDDDDGGFFFADDE